MIAQPELPIRRCIVCGDVYLPLRLTHRLCRRCYHWHAFGMALERFVRRPHKVVP